MSKLPKLIGKGLIILMPFFIVWAYLYFFPMNYIDNEVPFYIWNRDYCTTPHEEKPDVIIVGDSAMNSDFVPEEMGDKVMNLAMGGSSPAENYYVLQDYIRSNGAPKVVYMGFGDTHLQNSSAFYERTLYSRRFNFWQEKEMIDMTKENGDATINRPGARLDWLQYHFSFPAKYISVLIKADFIGRRAENYANYELVGKNHGRYIISNEPIGDRADYEMKDFYVEPYLDVYFRKMIELCLENGVKVRIVRPPLCPTVTRAEEYLNSMYGYHEGLKEAYPEIEIDYNMEEREVDDFYDHWHLTEDGARKFSRDVAKLHPEDFR